MVIVVTKPSAWRTVPFEILSDFRYGPRHGLRTGVGFTMAWFEVSNSRLGYRGRIDYAPVGAWMATTDGAAALSAVASRFRFRLLGRQRAARRQVWQDLS